MKLEKAIEDFRYSLWKDNRQDHLALNVFVCLEREIKENREFINRQAKLIKLLGGEVEKEG